MKVAAGPESRANTELVPHRFVHRLPSFAARKRPTFTAANAASFVGHCRWEHC
jgi:hypothetical protein